MQVGNIGRGQLVRRELPRGRVTENATTRFVDELHRKQAGEGLQRLQESIGRLDHTAGRARLRRTTFTDPSARSSDRLEFDLGATPTRLRSTQAINTVSTSFSTTNPDWTRGSTAPVTLGGVYDGGDGTDTIRFRMIDRGSEWRVVVQDSSNTRIDRFDFAKTDPRGTVYDIDNGMTISFGAGVITHNDRFWIDVDDDDPQAPNATGAFNGLAAAGPNFEPGVIVTAGSFTVNGTTVVVEADDSISTVLDKITTTTDVTAIYDPGTETVVLAHTVDGPAGTIAVASDTSGFLDAVKLSGAAQEVGRSSDLTDRTLDSIDAFSGVTSGTLRVNGTAVSFDVSTDSLVDVLNRIETNLPGVSAGYIRSSDTVVLRGAGRSLDLDDGGTGLLDAINIRAGRHNAARRDDVGVVRRARQEINREMANVVKEVNELLRLSRTHGTLLAGFAAAATSLFAGREESGDLDVVGLSTRTRDGDIGFSDSGARRLERALERDPDQVMAVFFGGGAGSTGLLHEMDVMVAAATSINTRFG